VAPNRSTREVKTPGSDSIVVQSWPERGGEVKRGGVRGLEEGKVAETARQREGGGWRERSDVGLVTAWAQ